MPQHSIHHWDGDRLQVTVPRCPGEPWGIPSSTSVYRKPTHTDRYMSFSSHHHPRTLTGVIRGMRDRAHHISDGTKRQAKLQYLEGVFQANGFPKALVKKTLSTIPTSTESQEVSLESLPQRKNQSHHFVYYLTFGVSVTDWRKCANPLVFSQCSNHQQP